MELKTIIDSFEIEGGIESIQQLNIGLINTRSPDRNLEEKLDVPFIKVS